jgi:hypothetical protein
LIFKANDHCEAVSYLFLVLRPLHFALEKLAIFGTFPVVFKPHAAVHQRLAPKTLP